MNHTPPDDNSGADEAQNSDWERRRKRRRQRLRDQFQDSRRRHDPPPNPEEWEPDPTWKHILKTMWDNPMTLVLVAIMIAVVWYILFPPQFAFV